MNLTFTFSFLDSHLPIIIVLLISPSAGMSFLPLKLKQLQTKTFSIILKQIYILMNLTQTTYVHVSCDPIVTYDKEIFIYLGLFGRFHAPIRGATVVVESRHLSGF